jgi:hypothetical protein
MGVSTQDKQFLRDFFTGYGVTITGDHTYIHQGLGYELSGVTPSIASGNNFTVALITPAASVGYVHLRPTAISSTANTLQMRIAEGSTITGGTDLVPNNRNRLSSRPCGCGVKFGATLTEEGTVLQYYQVGSGSNAGNARGGATDGSAEEWVLKPSTIYTFRFANIGASTATVATFNMFWYEESKG